MKTYVIYHKGCFDGFGAALAAWLVFGDRNPYNGTEVSYVPAHYGDPLPEIESGSAVYMVDVSWSRKAMEEWKAANNVSCLTILDHHHTAEVELKDMPGAFFDMNKSGAVLAYEFFHPNEPVPGFFLYLQDSDLWKFELPQSEEVRTAMRLYDFQFKVWEELIFNLDKLKSEGEVALRLTNKIAHQSARHYRWAVAGRDTFEGGTVEGSYYITFFQKQDDAKVLAAAMAESYVFPITNAAAFVSEVAHQLLDLVPDEPFVGYYFDREDGKRQWGLRSRPGYDCSVVAKLFGGGGHKQAAGFTTDP